MRRFSLLCLLVLLCSLAWGQVKQPPLPEKNGPVTITVQDDPAKPARELVVTLFYPKGRLANVSAQTGLMLSLHNWGGLDFDGAPNPNALVSAFNVVGIAVRYFQSKDDPKDPTPYDFGYLQAMDALRALAYVYEGLQAQGIPFDTARIYGTGGSGGGNVIQMANKFAPRTFACVVDLSGMASLTDDIAYNLPGGSGLDARYRRDPTSPAFLSKGMQEIRDLGNPAHLKLTKQYGNQCKIVVVHGTSDNLCLVADKQRVVAAMLAAGLDVEPHFITDADIDGKMIRNTGHSIGDRTGILLKFAAPYLTPGNPLLCRLTDPCDFVRHAAIRYPTSDGVVTINYLDGWPQLSVVKNRQ